MAPYIRDKRHLVGLILVLIGIVLILDNIRFFPHFIPYWVWSWQFLLIAIGSFSLLTTDKTGPGIILIGIGSVFLLSDILPDFFNWFTNDRNMFWYLIMILVGISLIVKRKRDHAAQAGQHSRRRGFGADTSKDSGTGLGLSICKNLIKKINGSISIKDFGPLSGATFSIDLPSTNLSPEVI